MGLRLYDGRRADHLSTAGAGSASAAIGCGSVITKDTKLKKDIHCENVSPASRSTGTGSPSTSTATRSRGRAPMEDVAVSTSGDEDVVVRNRTLRGFGHSIIASGGAGLLVDDMLIRRQESQPIDDLRVQRRQGQALAHPGERGCERARRRIQGVTVNGNTLTEGGIEFMSGSDHAAAENSIEGTGGFGLSARPGISFVGVEGGLARGNEVSDTVQAGIVVSGGHDIDVIGNDVRDSELSSISVQAGR